MMAGIYILTGLGLVVYLLCFALCAYLIYELATTITFVVRDILFKWSDNKVKRLKIKKNKDANTESEND